MKIHIAPHTLQRANERGASEGEIIEVIQSGEKIPAKWNAWVSQKYSVSKVLDSENFTKKKKLKFITYLNEKMFTPSP